MTMTLGFDVGGFLDAVLDADTTEALLRALARHAPAGPLRYGRDTDVLEIVELDRDGSASTPGDADAVRADVAAVGSYAVWGNDEAPLGVGPLILPGGGWDLDALHADPALRAEAVRWHVDRVFTSDVARPYFDRGHDLLDVAERHRLILVLR